MKTQISPMLAVNDGKSAIEFYKSAFGAELLWNLGDGGVAGMSSVTRHSFWHMRSPGTALVARSLPVLPP
jgi:uncharacterized glyoxalase superfamily protein PhnB